MGKNDALVQIGQQIRNLRIERGYSQEEFAYNVGIDRSYMGGIERGERNLAALNLIKIARVLKVEVGELFPAIKKLNI